MTGDLFGGRADRDKALAMLESTPTREAWIAAALWFAINRCLTHGTVSGDDLARDFPPPAHWDARIIGAVFNTQRRGFPFVEAYMTHTTRKHCHAGRMMVWKLDPDSPYGTKGG